MTIQISSEAVMLLVIGCVVGLAVYKHTTRTHTGASTRGDLVGAIGATVGVMTVLALLFSLGDAGETLQRPGPASGPTTMTSAETRAP